MMIFSLVAMTGLEKCCITSAYLQWLCHSGERPVARGPLVCDISKAFDRDWLLHKLSCLGITGDLLQWFKRSFSSTTASRS